MFFIDPETQKKKTFVDFKSMFIYGTYAHFFAEWLFRGRFGGGGGAGGMGLCGEALPGSQM